MANYGNGLLEDFINAWHTQANGLGGDDFDPEDVELKAAWLDFDHAGRYSLKFRNQGFDVSGFGDRVTDEDTGHRTCPFWRYVTSPDVNYYDAEFKALSRPAYDVALYLEAFSDSDAFMKLSDTFGDLFDAVRFHDSKMLASAASRLGAELSSDGRVSVDCTDRYGLELTFAAFPADV